MNPTDTLFVAGHRGMVGSAIVRRLQALGCTNILTAGRDALDLTDQHAVNAFFAAHRIDRSIWPRPRSAATTPTTPTRPSSSTRT